MTVAEQLTTTNGVSVATESVPLLSFDSFADRLAEQLDHNTSGLSALFGVPTASQTVRLYAVTNRATKSEVTIFATDVGDSYPALSVRTPQAHWFEREIAEQWGIVPEGHPWLKPIRFHRSYVATRDAWGRSENEEILPSVQPQGTDYFKIRGDEIHEVAVGPVHAGVIEPGHFRFQCHGENVFSLEIELGFQHRGIERQLLGGPDKRSLHFMETLSGDTSIGHATTYCQALEGLAGVDAPLRAHSIRAIALEFERLANHTGDLGALAMDVGFLPTASFCGRLRGDWLNASALICGNRFGRATVRPGGVQFDLDEERIDELQTRIDAIYRDVTGAAELLWNTPSVMARFEGCGVVPRHVADDLGLVGIAGRACGIDRDARRDFPFGIFRFHQIPVSTSSTGDVFSRAYVRWLEIQRSVRFIQEQLRAMPKTATRRDLDELKGNQFVVSIAEGWRGEICHVALTNHEGQFEHYKVVDPSFHNWIGLAMALRNQEISDFPVNNKSFNLSYCGHDL
ncbi:Formate hydrogenlyase subunit 5 precursor [Novipirellula aureliae]|uniref:Formate hydrogenlyase subunit 5 n=1 Tax=Novipirellula aureliae TaxID=2527966 RepID=A0A5C6DF35_9BACT|nr:NADH-quinone oxidoreductase subunit C [Novipirellula aureliae]TWU34544.1 Formate hydrogenlyase subunit 5 precursor [Novipirellula aureliae]